MRLAKSILLASTILTASSFAAFADVKVVTSIKPIHSLVSAVMEGVGTPELIIDGVASPHDFAMRPSQARMLESADIVFWVGHEMESFLEKPMETVGGNAKSVELMDAHDLVKLEFREGGAFEKHGHDDHEGHGHDDHASHDKDDDHDDHDHDKEAKHDDHDKEADSDHDHDHDKEETAEADGHKEHDDHAHGEFDAHIWLDPKNAKAIVHEIEEVLASADPANAEKYEANAEKAMEKIDALIADVSGELESVKDKGYIVFHDAYQYFEQRFGVSASGSITVSPDVMPGAERISEIRARVKDLGATCVFAEPQFEPKLITTVIEGTSAKSGIIDPLGSSLENGPDLYFKLIRNMASAMKNCLSKAS